MKISAYVFDQGMEDAIVKFLFGPKIVPVANGARGDIRIHYCKACRFAFARRGDRCIVLISRMPFDDLQDIAMKGL